MMYIVLLFFALSVIASAYTDAYKDNTGKRNHVFKILSLILFGAGCLIAGYILGGLYDNEDPDLYRKTFLLISSYILIRTGLFNLSYNQFRELPIGYLGKTDEVFDKWINRLPTVIILIIYFLSIFFSIVCVNSI